MKVNSIMTNTIQPSTSFFFEDEDVAFTADPGDIRSCAIFYDEGAQQWCAGVTVRENYSKLRFDDEAAARRFVKALHKAKQDELVRLTANVEIREQRKGVV